jgi:hypothetical protein
MIELPLALVERWPMDEYRLQHQSLVSALKHNVSDALLIMSELEKLRGQITGIDDKVEKIRDKRLAPLITEKEERLFRLIKFSDYSAMIMAAWPQSTFMTYDDWFEQRDQLTNSVLIRGISKGKVIQWCQTNQRDFYFIETGYLGNYPSANNRTGRKIYHRIVRNDMQHRKIWNVPADRLEKLWNVVPYLRYRGWRHPGKNILLVLNTEKPFKFYGQDRQAWIDSTIATIRQHTDRPIIVRDKAGRQERTNDTIYDAFQQDIHAVVCYNSIAAVEAVAAGIPAFALAPTAAEPVASNDLTKIETPYRPDTDLVMAWLCSIAYGQFSLDEIITGRAWALVQENRQREYINC